jgi:SAM-dependent methyltransferase
VDAAELRGELRAYWDRDSATYDHAASHRPRSAGVNAAWAAALRRLLPPPPVRVLDVGAGTGFVSLTLARLGYEVTALDSAPGMLDRLRDKAAEERLDVRTVEADAGHPPDGPFDVIVERHLIWTLPDPAGTLEAWRRAAPDGRLVLLESLWGDVADTPERLRVRAREFMRSLRGHSGDHHADYDPEWSASLPFGRGTRPEDVAALVTGGPWAPARLHRLRDVEWATAMTLPPWERLLGVSPRFAVVGGR